jgi:hypothetical protein
VPLSHEHDQVTLLDGLLACAFGLIGLGSFVLAGWLNDRKLGPYARAWADSVRCRERSRQLNRGTGD